jgi:hypothetical protein
MRHTLLPRSTGLLFCLRDLAQKVPDLKIVDLTVAYPGMCVALYLFFVEVVDSTSHRPSEGYGQDYYTLQSVFGHGQAPVRSISFPEPKLNLSFSLLSTFTTA